MHTICVQKLYAYIMFTKNTDELAYIYTYIHGIAIKAKPYVHALTNDLYFVNA